MVNIVTGKINSGKSTTMLKTFEKNPLGDGFISVKSMHYEKVHGYDIVKLSTRESRLLVIRDEFLTHDVNIACQIGPYLFLKETLDYVEEEIRKMIKNNVTPIYLDEIGQLELYDQCFDKIFKEIIDANVECYITVREDLISEVTKKYNLNEINIIKT